MYLLHKKYKTHDNNIVMNTGSGNISIGAELEYKSCVLNVR